MAPRPNETQTPENSQANDTNRPLFRVNYSYTVGPQLRQGQFILPGNNPGEAKQAALDLLKTKYEGTGSVYRIGTIKPF